MISFHSSCVGKGAWLGCGSAPAPAGGEVIVGQGLPAAYVWCWQLGAQQVRTSCSVLWLWSGSPKESGAVKDSTESP